MKASEKAKIDKTHQSKTVEKKIFLLKFHVVAWTIVYQFNKIVSIYLQD